MNIAVAATGIKLYAVAGDISLHSDKKAVVNP
jgi:hypothetical protein